MQTQPYYYYSPNIATGTTGVTLSSNTTATPWIPVQPSKEPSRFRKLLKSTKNRVPKLALRPSHRHLPPMSGASPESEVSIHTEHKKKITFERKVGITRMKGGSKQDTHKGTIEFVRTMEGPEHQRENIGIKSEGNGSSFVEIPIDKLRQILDELDPQEEQ